ncbi:hypothetical protein PTTG_30503 [Puccinia triticina 1-1 BBBD Race 1]|uniref:Uncharacterized protein n=1 Tax=Puccinia triticina (isolate 1-1 / race 1 (BBBD)) TaxID=630390 RepID=A0A180FYH8_PUCT1|nr:hypothetical protein PTTG_30503 [Puccinia triticina 1-1 BBBD Race 1]
MGSTTTPTCLHMGLAWTHTDTTPVPTQWRTLNIKAKGTRGSNSATSLIRACEPLGIGESDLWALLKLQLTLVSDSLAPRAVFCAPVFLPGMPGANPGINYSSPSTSPALSRSSQSSVTGSVGVRPDNLELIGNALQTIESTFTLSPDLIQRAQPLIQMSAEERTLAILLLALHRGPPPPQPLLMTIADPTPPQSTPDPTQGYSTQFKSYLQNTV